MKTIMISLYGITINFRYRMHQEKTIEWYLDKDASEMADQECILLEFLLRRYCKKYIEDCISFYEHLTEQYEADAKASALAEEDINL